MKNDVKRENLKNNFLKNIIVRFDYTGIAESELDNIIAKLKPIFKAAEYTKFKEEYLTELDFELQDPEVVEMEGLPVKEVRKKRAYVFLNEEKGIKCKISTRFTFVSIQSQKYISFSKYSKTLIEVMKLLREDVEFLNFVRFGIRKVNQCIIKDVTTLNKYFTKDFFNLYGLQAGNTPKLFENKDCFQKGNYNFNLMRMLVEGQYEDNVAYQVSLDTDIYVTDDEIINELIANDTEMMKMNEQLFDMYKEALTEPFIEKLGQENYEDSNIIGVEKNE